VVALFLGIFWRRFTPTAALWTMGAGSLCIAASIVWPQMIAPLAHGVEMREVGDGLLAGKDQFKFMRGFFGLVVCSAIGISVTLVSRARPLSEIRGLVWGTVSDAIEHYKGSPGREHEGSWAEAAVDSLDQDLFQGEANLAVVHVSEGLAHTLGDAKPGDLVYISDRRAWLGGLRSGHGVIGRVVPGTSSSIYLGPSIRTVIIAKGREEQPLRIRKLY
ncbi:MAG TPA: hypothetical protein DIU15_14050, partial [Deltaproteobacteria bacterium]|nr:hypothetical protein [Deltaproteobacteria bacterium]